jgi:hypothetical protein
MFSWPEGSALLRGELYALCCKQLLPLLRLLYGIMHFLHQAWSLRTIKFTGWP